MATFFNGKDRETCNRAGAAEMYQICSLTVDSGDGELDIFDQINPGNQFLEDDCESLKEYLSEKINLKVKDICIEEV
jgi:hypothetical protein